MNPNKMISNVDDIHLLADDYNVSNDYLGCYAIFDNESRLYDTPFYCHNDIYAKRHFTQISETGIIKDYKPNYELHRIGFFNKFSGNLEPYFEKLAGGK